MSTPVATRHIAETELSRDEFFDQADAAYAALRADTALWQQELEERALWEGTLLDGQEQDEAAFAPSVDAQYQAAD